MNAQVPGIESFLDERFSVDKFPTTTDSGRVLAAGYSFHSETFPVSVLETKDRSPRAAILYADTVNSDPKTEDGAGETRLGLLKGRKLFRGLVAGFGGKFACYTGNFIIAEFLNVETALQCAVNAQIALRNQLEGEQGAHQIRYRLGVEVGKTDSAVNGQAGRAVDLVAEAERGEHPGAIYVSQLAREYLREKSLVRFVSMGMRYAHDSGEPVEAFWIEMDRSMLFGVS